MRGGGAGVAAKCMSDKGWIVSGVERPIIKIIRRRRERKSQTAATGRSNINQCSGYRRVTVPSGGGKE